MEQTIGFLEDLHIPDARRKISQMVVCDFILANSDRHWRNFGLIRNVHTLQIEDLAPLFDTGTCLGASQPDPLIRDCDARPFHTSPQVQLKMVRDWSWFHPEKLEGFSDEVRSVLRQDDLLHPARIAAILDFLQDTIHTVLSRKEEMDSHPDSACPDPGTEQEQEPEQLALF